MIFNNLSSDISKIVTGNYKLVTDDKNIMKKYGIANKNFCDYGSIFEKTSPVPIYGHNRVTTGYNYDSNKPPNNKYKDGFIARKFCNNIDDYDKIVVNENVYKFKKNISNVLTDIFMQHTLNNNNRIIITNYIFSVLNYSINCLIENLVYHNKFNIDIKMLLDNIKLLYKGGNTTRLLFNSFKNNFKNTKTAELIDEIIQSDNIGDWDYQIKVNRDRIALSDAEMVDLLKLIMQVMFVTCIYLKDKLEIILNSKDGINNTVKEIKNNFFSVDYMKNINNFIKEYNKGTTYENQIEIMTLNKVYTYNKIIEKNRVSDFEDTDYKKINKNSFIYDKGNKEGFNHYFETDTHLYDNEKEDFFPDYLDKNMVYIAYLNKLFFINRYMVSDFRLHRVKITSSFEFTINYKRDSNISLNKLIYANMELVDISLQSEKQNKLYCVDYYIKLLKINDNAMYIDYILDSYSDFDNSNKYNKVQIPSPEFMFIDILVILYHESLHPWDNLKYVKRLNRLIYLALLCLVNENDVQDVERIFKNVRDLFIQYNNANSCDNKLKIISNYEIIKADDFNNNKTDMYTNIDVNYYQIKLNDTIHYSKYFNIIIQFYIRSILIINYITKGKSYKQSMSNELQLIISELQCHRIVELKNKNEYLNDNIILLTEPLKQIVNTCRGSDDYNLGPNDNILKVAQLQLSEVELSENIKNEINKFENAIINNCDKILEILDTIKEEKINIKYSGASLY